MCDWDDRKKKEEHHEIVIQDRRHLRGTDDEDLTETEPVAAEPTPPPAEPDAPGPDAEESVAAAPGEVVEFRQPERRPAAASPVEEPEQPEPPSSAEEAQLRMLFEMGVTGYLQGQLQLLLTFAVIYLGHQPNPANGLVSADLEKARLAIDMLDFIVSRTKDEMQPAEYANLAKLVTELKMDFAQVAQQVSPVAPDPGLGN